MPAAEENHFLEVDKGTEAQVQQNIGRVSRLEVSGVDNRDIRASSKYSWHIGARSLTTKVEEENKRRG